METKTLQTIDPLVFLQKMNPKDGHAFMSWSKDDHGWKRIIAFNPVETYQYFRDDDDLLLDSFIEEHCNRLLAGYLAYDLGYELHQIKQINKGDLDLPLVHFSAFSNFIQFDQEKTLLHYLDKNYPDQIMEIQGREIKEFPSVKIGKFETSVDLNKYRAGFDRIQQEIRSGEYYQINYAHQMTTNSPNSGKELFLHYFNKNPANYTAFFETDLANIISLSPESFIHIKERQITTKPIKGTRRRGANPVEDERLRIELLGSQKEEAELYMIIDLLRNDLGKICKTGSVALRERKKIQSLSNVFHTYAEITGELKSEIREIDALLSMFPGGSITGCPKVRAMQAIDELETNPRGVYTGSVGYFLPGKEMEFNIAIRTIVQKGRKLFLGVGGGITLLSEVEMEYDETFDKARSFLQDDSN